MAPVNLADAVFLRFRTWEKWQGEAVYDRMRKRKKGGRQKALTLAYIAIATDLDDASGNFAAFALAVGGGINARGYLVALLGWVGRNASPTGVIRCTAAQLGPVVLTDRLDAVSRAQGIRVWNALVASGIAEEVHAAQVVEFSPPSSGEDAGEDAGRKPHLEGEGEVEEKENLPLPPPGAGGAVASPLSDDEREDWLTIRDRFLSGEAGDSWTKWAHVALTSDPPDSEKREVLSTWRRRDGFREACLGNRKLRRKPRDRRSA